MRHMSDLFGFNAYSPAEIAQRVESMGVAKARLPFLPMLMLGILAGAFIGLGGLFSMIVRADATLGFAAVQLLAGLTFSLGLLLVVVAGAELFTGNNLLMMAWADGHITTGELLRNWIIVCCANFIGAAGLAVLVFLSGHVGMNHGALADSYLALAEKKCSLPLAEAFFRGVLCNILVCLAVWMAMAGRSVTDKAIAIIFPVSAFIAAGFEHSIANMYTIPLALLIKYFGDTGFAADAVTLAGFARNLLAVLAGNLIGGSVLVGLVYHVIYQRRR